MSETPHQSLPQKSTAAEQMALGGVIVTHGEEGKAPFVSSRSKRIETPQDSD